MRIELNDLIRAIVDTRFAVKNVADTAIQDLHHEIPITYRGQTWGSQHFEAMERLHQGVEAAWHYAKWLQFPEMKSRLTDGYEALSTAIEVREIIFNENLLTDVGLPIASLLAIEPAKGDAMARQTVAELAKSVEELQEQMDEHVQQLNSQIADLENKIEELEGSGDKRRTRSQMSPEDRKAAGERMQMGRAKKLGLDSIEQLRALKLRPGQKPTKKQIDDVKKTHPFG